MVTLHNSKHTARLRSPKSFAALSASLTREPGDNTNLVYILLNVRKKRISYIIELAAMSVAIIRRLSNK